MPKRSLPNQRELERLDQAIDAMLARRAGKAIKAAPSLRPLLRLAEGLRDLPRQGFKTNLKRSLERSASMPTTAEPIAAVRTVASPRLSYKDPAKAIEFYEKAFGAKESWRFEVEGNIAHAEIKIGDSAILVCGEWPEGGRFSAETLGQSPVGMVLHVADADAFIAHAVAAGAKVIRPIADQFYGHREGTMVDPFGYAWTASTVKEEMPVEEMHRRFRAMMAKQPAPPPLPRGLRTVTPYLVAQDAPALLDFIKQTFGGEETERSIGSAGGIHAEIRLGDSVLMVGGGAPELSWKGESQPTGLHVYVEDTDAVYQRALEAGAVSIQEPADQDYGERSGSVKDAAGNHWYIATHQGPKYIPEGLNTVNVCLHPLRAEPVIGFLTRAFGAKQLSKYASPDGVVHHAELRIGDSVIEMGEAHGPYQPMPTMFYLYVPDVDEAYQRALAAGAASMFEPKEQPYGDRNAGVKDPFGNQWYLAAPVKK
jgi:PhnB protein